jgi:hypothetical protein
MVDKPEAKDLEAVLARLKEEWQELVGLLSRQSRSQDRVIEVEKILFRDAAGRYRGEIGTHPDGPANLLLSGPEGEGWVRLGVNREGEASLELQDQRGEGSFKVAMNVPAFGAGPGAGLFPAGASAPEAAPSPGTPAESAPASEAHPGAEGNAGLVGRLEQLERQHRRHKFYNGLLWGVLGVLLAIGAYTLFCPYRAALSVGSLTVRAPNGTLGATLGAEGGNLSLELWDQKTRRATLGLGADGDPYLAFYDRQQRLRAELRLRVDGEPHFTLRDHDALQGRAAPNTFSDSGQGPSRGGAVSGSEEGTVASGPPISPGAVSPKREVEPEGEYVGFIKSNKYHYPTCKWARGANPLNSIRFKSAAEAQERRYIPCPVCKPPPLSR